MELESYIQQEQAKAICENRRLVLLGITIITSVTVWMFWSAFSHTLLLIWAGLAFLIVVFRWFFYSGFDPNNLSADDCRRLQRLHLFWSFVSGFHMGLIPVVFLSSDTTFYTLFVTIIYVGFASSAMSANLSYPLAFYSLAIPSTVMFAGRFLYEGGRFYTALGIMICVYLGMNFLLSRNSYRLFRQAKEFEFKNMVLMDELVVQKEAAEQATLSKNQFLAAASHDLRQPLHASGLLLSALNNHVVDSEGREILDEIHASNQALNHSFNSLLDVSKLDAGVIEAQMQHVVLNSLLASFDRECKLQAEQKGLRYYSSGEQCVAFTDPILLERVLHNLLSNAFNYTERGEVELNWRSLSNGSIRILIRDTGIGIHEQELQHIFSEYYQINNPERDRDKGFGLGLAIVTRLCEIITARLYVSSELGKGSVFALYLPAGELSNAQSPVGQNNVVSDLSGVTALVIDDDPSVRKSMFTLLSAWRCEVLVAESERQAVNAVVSSDVAPHIIIADYRLREEKTGVEAINRVRDEINQSVPAIIITGDTSPDHLQSITVSGFPVLHKPVSAAVLRSAIQRQLMAAISDGEVADRE